MSEITRHLGVLNAQQWRQVIIDTYRNLDRYNNAAIPSEPHWTAIDSLNPMNNGECRLAERDVQAGMAVPG